MQICLHNLKCYPEQFSKRVNHFQSIATRIIAFVWNTLLSDANGDILLSMMDIELDLLISFKQTLRQRNGTRVTILVTRFTDWVMLKQVGTGLIE